MQESKLDFEVENTTLFNHWVNSITSLVEKVPT